jgi:SAM-dependent methyltransferase
MRQAFERIVSLPEDLSDNAGRVRRIIDFAATHFGAQKRPSVLDVGSGLCVFLHGMNREGWRCTAMDPDPRAVRHGRELVGVEAICADFSEAQDLGHYDVVTFNKVLEHVVDPIAMLQKARGIVSDAGFVYVELPDGEGALQDPVGVEREEFFVEHIHIFAAASVALLAARAGFTLLSLERVREPSTKYTLRAFLSPRSPVHPR